MCILEKEVEILHFVDYKALHITFETTHSKAINYLTRTNKHTHIIDLPSLFLYYKQFTIVVSKTLIRNDIVNLL